jgi:hypothetical protein
MQVVSDTNKSSSCKPALSASYLRQDKSQIDPSILSSGLIL